VNSSFRRAATALLLALGAALPAQATAPTVQEAQTLLDQGDYAGALGLLDAYLAHTPQDAEARFTRGLALVKLNRIDEAITVFSDLTRDYPKLPEPYNNLAVLYAQKGEYEKARDALEAALATHPAYATAHENLGDIYAALAAAAYNRALQLDQDNPTVRQKLSLIDQITNLPGTVAGTAAAPTREAGNPPPPAPAAAPPAAAVVAAVPAPPAPSNTPAAVSSEAASAAPAPAVSSAAETAPVASAPAPAPVESAEQTAAVAASSGASNSSAAGDDRAILEVVDAWAQAWSLQDPKAYLSYYADEFKPEGGLSRAAWEAQRRERLTTPAHISVTVLKPQINRLDAHHVEVSFVQDYTSGNFSDRVNKTLELSDRSGSWKIVREVVH
jgi:hypothetical protein